MVTARFRKQSLLVGTRIRSLRKDRTLTQMDLAGRIGIQQSDLCRMENGEYKVSLETLFKILAIFEMNMSEFFHEEVQGAGKERDAELMHQYHRLPARAQDEVMEFVQFKLQLEDTSRKST